MEVNLSFEVWECSQCVDYADPNRCPFHDDDCRQKRAKLLSLTHNISCRDAMIIIFAIDWGCGSAIASWILTQFEAVQKAISDVDMPKEIMRALHRGKAFAQGFEEGVNKVVAEEERSEKNARATEE